MDGEKKVKLNDRKTEIIVIQGNLRQTRDNDHGVFDARGVQLLPVK